MSQIYYAIQRFVAQAVHEELLHPYDELYVRNQLLGLLQLNNYPELSEFKNSDRSVNLLEEMDAMAAYAVSQSIISSSSSEREIFEAAIMDLITPLPSELNRHFWSLYQADPVQATGYFYELSQRNNYIQTRRIARNVAFSGETNYGPLEITINLSKPEKDPAEIARARALPQVNYPKCALCMENEGYQGHQNHPARQNHRIVRLTLGGEEYGFQYSPYVYYNEHSIVLSRQHIPMVVDRKCLSNLVEFVQKFPHYFIGSNADLPGVGGSILTHDHYQAGRYEFPMASARVYDRAELAAFPEVSLELIEWPMSVLRLASKDPDQLIEVGDFILKQWRAYSDEALGIYHYTDAPHNTVTPIVRTKNGLIEMDIVLRNNRTSDEFPLGIYHPHPDVHHIKKENIGLIEVMGLAILPPRLETEITAVKDYLLGKIALSDVAEIHQDWAQELDKADTEAVALEIIRVGMVQKFTRVLEDAGVYKNTPAGRGGLKRFIASWNK